MNENIFTNNAQLKQIGEKIASARRAQGEKGATVAKAIDVTQAVISQIENGSYHSMKVITLIKLCDYLDIPFSDLL